MSRKVGGLGTSPAAPAGEEDFLASMFGDKIPKPQGAQKERQDTPRRPSAESKPDLVGKHFMIDRALAKQLKLFAVEQGMKEREVIEKALVSYFNNESNQ